MTKEHVATNTIWTSILFDSIRDLDLWNKHHTWKGINCLQSPLIDLTIFQPVGLDTICLGKLTLISKHPTKPNL